jgi:hypothetical protein
MGVGAELETTLQNESKIEQENGRFFAKAKAGFHFFKYM